MIKNIKLLFFIFLIAGCAINQPGLYESFLLRVPCDEARSLAIISISFVPVFGGQAQVSKLELVTIEDGKIIQVPETSYYYISFFHNSLNWFGKNYSSYELFNLPEGEYYISKIHILIGKDEYGRNRCDDVIKNGDGSYVYKGQDKHDDIYNPPVIISRCTPLVIEQMNYKEHPITVKKGKFTVHGNLNIKRPHGFSDKAELVQGEEVDFEKVKNYYLSKTIGSKWYEIVNNTD